MKQKFNKFETLFEAAFSHFSNGGFREGTPIIIKPSFLKDKYFKKHFSEYCTYYQDFSPNSEDILSSLVIFVLNRQYTRSN